MQKSLLLGLIVLVLVGAGVGGIRSSVNSSRDAADLEAQMAAMGSALRTYARETRGEIYPPVSSTPGVVFMDAASLFPNYLDDPAVVVSPKRPNARALRRELAQAAADPATIERIGAESFYYLGYVAEFEIVGLAFVGAYRDAVSAGELEQVLDARGLPVAYPDDYTGPREPPVIPDNQSWNSDGPGTAGSNQIQRIREGIERFLIVSASGPRGSARAQCYIPLLIERPTRIGRPIRVLYLDQRIAEVPFGEYPNTRDFLEGLESLRGLRQDARL